MCGIAGIVGPGARAALPGMLGEIAHRGPDDEGTWFDDARGVALAHRRLSIIDPTPAGHQPMASADGRLWMVYNGEVYNFAELRAELEGAGESFRSHTDTEVILAGWARWGPAVLPRLRGMFAFALWDAARGELFLARDRFGIKPLYWARTADGAFAFASEIAALLAGGVVSRRVDPQSVWEFLSYGAVAQPRTILADARALAAGHWMRVRGAETETVRWWDLEEATRDRRRALADVPYPEAVEGVRERLRDAARAHMVADVPVGAFLSGGMDSTGVVGLASELVAHPLRTFAVGFEARHAALSELAWARKAAERFGTEHTEVVVTAADAAASFEALVEAWDQPSLDGTNTWFVSRAARARVPVSLSGVGGDELFAGYPHFRRFALGCRLAPAGAPGLEPFGRMLPRRWRGELQAIAAAPVQRLAAVRRLMTEEEKARAVAADLPRGESPAERVRGMMREGLDPVQQVSYAEARGYLRDTLLRDVDAMAMAHALEVRPVLLDHELAEYVFALPARHKLAPGRSKPLLADALADVVPDAIARRRKMGFELPLNAWLGTVLRERARALLDGRAARELFAPAHLAALRTDLDALAAGAPRPPRAWAHVVLLAYAERHGLHAGEG
ncbi:MAG TPA: asparagine synthase (glutamine-hydrolyzing) [Longimicrobium sp.]|nr:asparagine synthase (glutamine-hydrolyzing) [Longimicrobium sp.]